MTGAHIAAIEYYLPARVITNAELDAQHPQWQMGQVALRSGVERRHWCGADETALDLAEGACRRLAERSGFDLGRAGALIFCTQSPDHVMPPNACLLQSRLGLPDTIAAFDFTLACSGFVYGLYLAKALIGSGAVEHVLLVTAETYSKWIHPDDRGPMTLFGDAGAVTLVSAGEPAIGGFLLGTDGHKAGCFMVPAGGARVLRSAETAALLTDHNANIRSAEHLYMNGLAVLDFVKEKIPSVARGLLEQERLTMEDLDLVVFHQASQVTLDHLHVALRIPKQKQFVNIACVGNTVSASLPIALRDAERQGKLTPGMRLMLVGFGVGLSWGACILTWK